MSNTDLHENPLVPNKKLRQIYLAMAEARALDDHIAKFQKPIKGARKLDSMRGQEALRVSMTIDLEAGDLVSDSQPGVVMDLLTGEKVNSLLKQVAALSSGKKIKEITTTTVGRLLPWIDDGSDRLRMAMGAALSFKTSGPHNVVIVFARRDSVSKGDWWRLLSLASKLELPVIFAVLPSKKGERKSKIANLCDTARRSGVPGIPVDAGDAVALYRVAQESMGRIRGGDGPVLIECLDFPTQGKGGIAPVDPLSQLGDFLVLRKVCSAAWLKGAGNGLRRRLEAARR